MTQAEMTTQGELIFALDIGTRSVIGVVGEVDGEMLKVLAIESMEHTRRAMLDGQVEDIGQVAKIAQAVKERLEAKVGVTLSHVCIAAAGRSLKTRKSTFEIEFEEKQAISRSLVTSWEMTAVQNAYKELLGDENDAKSYSCVGYSVIKYYLDGYPIQTLVDHRGVEAKIDVVATFLPDEVIESLYEVTSRLGLTVTNLTLEPIAAMNAIIPQELRMLNLALVDIGAGTSDIAISNGGSVTAYTMVTLAGDEVSEALVQALLVDFATAERLKQELSQNLDAITYEDVIGFEYTKTSEEVFELIKSCAEHLCKEIATAITNVNGEKPAAVFLVGGGSRLVNMASIMANALDIPENKVAVGGSNYMKKMLKSDVDLTNAEYATPLGIAITAMNMKEKSSITVTVNDQPVNLFKNSVITVMDALLMSGCKQNQLIGRNGQSVTFELNDHRVVVRGGFPVPAQVEINGKSASLTTPINHGDDIVVKAAIQGKDATPKLSEHVGNLDFYIVTLNGEDKNAGTRVYVNDVEVNDDVVINNLDQIKIAEVFTAGQLLLCEGFNTWDYDIIVNGSRVEGGFVLSTLDNVRCVSKTAPIEEFVEAIDGSSTDSSETNSDMTDELSATPTATLTKNKIQTPVVDPPQPEKPIYSGKTMTVLINGESLELPLKADGGKYLFFDMLNFVDIDPSKPQGNIVLMQNGRNAEYLNEVSNGDNISIYWERREQ